MKFKKIIAASGALALVSGALALGIDGSARAESQSFNLYSQINPGFQPTPVPQGNKNVAMTVTPATGGPGTPIEVKVTSSDLAFANGPASPITAGTLSLDAVIGIAGTDYTLRGSAVGQSIPTNTATDTQGNPLPPPDGTAGTNTYGDNPQNFNAGWTISSTAGNSVSTSTIKGSGAWTDGAASGTSGTKPGTGGLGAYVRGTEVAGPAVSLVSPAAAGTYPITLKAIVANSGTAAVNDGFDQVVNTSSTAAKNGLNNNVAASFITFTNPVNVVVEGPKLSVEKTTDAEAFVAGDVVDYDFEVTNSGSIPIDGPFTIQDPLLDAAATCPATATLAAGASITCTGSLTADAADASAGEIVNTATATGSVGDDPVVSEESEHVLPLAEPALELTKTANDTSFAAAGDELSYTFEIENTGTVTVTNVAIDDPKLDGAATCIATTLAPGAITQCTGALTVDATDVTAKSIVNTATATGTYSGDPVESDEASATVGIAAPAMTFVKDAQTDAFSAAGDVLSYQFTVTNTGNTQLSSITVNDPKIPSTTCPVTTLAPTASVICSGTYTATAADVTAGKVDNTASATATANGTPFTSNTSTATVPVGGVTPPGNGGGVDTSPRTGSAVVKNVYCDTTNVGLGALTQYKNWPVSITVSPGAAAPGSTVSVSVSVDASATNGPQPIDPGQYRFEAAVKFNGDLIQLKNGPTSKFAAAAEAPIYRASELPLVAKGTIELPSTEGAFPIAISDIWYNNVKGSTATQGLKDTFDSRCNISPLPQTEPKAFVVPTVTVDSNADAPSVDAPVDDDPNGPGDDELPGDDESPALALTGSDTVALGLLALLALQVGAVITVRAYRASPRGPRGPGIV